MLPYTHFTLEERKYLQELLAQGHSMRKCAAYLGRSPSSVSREIKRNIARYKPHRSSNNRDWYNSWRAENLATQRRRQHRQAIRPGSPAWNYICQGLLCYWSPQTICGRWHKEHPNENPLHHSTIYRYVRNKAFPEIKAKTHFRRRDKHYVHRCSDYNTIHPIRTIPEWPSVIQQRLRIGDWEGDTVYGGVGKGLLVTLVDRKSRYVKIGLVKSRNADEVLHEILRLLEGLPVYSVSLDNGSEFSRFNDIERELETLVYFAQPHKPWQRGTNENTNDMIRFFFPKGFDFRTVTRQNISAVEQLLNNRPRRCLGWKTPAEVFSSKSVALD